MSIFHSSVEPFLRGLYGGMLINLHRSLEITVLQGRNHYMAATSQIAQLACAFEQMNKALKAYQLPERKMTVLTLGLPIGFGWLASRKISNLHARRFVNFTQAHLGSLSLTISVISNVALFAMGQHLMASASLVYLGLGFLDRRNILPERVHCILDKANRIIGNMGGIVFSNGLTRFLSLVDLALHGVRYVQAFRKSGEAPLAAQEIVVVPPREEPDQPVLVSKERLSTIDPFTTYPVNRAHLGRNLLPTVREEVTLDHLTALADQIDWENHRVVIQAKLQDDERWQEVATGTMDEVDYFKSCLQKFVNSVKNREILEGRPHNFQVLEIYCRYIAQCLQNHEEMIQADSLITLAIEGGEYCGPGTFRVVEEIYSNLISQAEGLPLENRILACLQQERLSIFQQIFDHFMNGSPYNQLMAVLFNVRDIHNYDALINLTQAGTRFGIPHQAAANDEAAYVSPAVEMMYKPLGTLLDHIFWRGGAMSRLWLQRSAEIQERDYFKPWKWIQLRRGNFYIAPYNQEAIIARLNVTIGTAQLPKNDIYEWWANWIQRQDLPEVEKVRLEQNLAVRACLNGEPLEDNQRKIKPKFLIAMLIEMGVLNF